MLLPTLREKFFLKKGIKYAAAVMSVLPERFRKNLCSVPRAIPCYCKVLQYLRLLWLLAVSIHSLKHAGSVASSEVLEVIL